MKLARNVSSNVSTAPISGQLCYQLNDGTVVPLGNKIGVRNRNKKLVNRIKKKTTTERNGGIEINKAEGGYKKITLPLKEQGVGINLHGSLLLVKIGDDWYYRIGMASNNYAAEPYIEIKNYLNSSAEFTNKLATTSQYRIRGINCCIRYQRMPNGGDKLGTLLMYVNTKKVEVGNPKIQKNVMRLNMNTTGTKNYNVRLNNTNMEKEDVQWTSSRELYEGTIRLHVDKMSKIKINEVAEQETTIDLGEIEINVDVVVRYTDVDNFVQPTKKFNATELIEKQGEDIKKLQRMLQQLQAKMTSLEY